MDVVNSEGGWSSDGCAAGSIGNGGCTEVDTQHALKPSDPDGMPTRNLGKTGYKVGIFSLGGQAALEHANNFDVAVPILNARWT